MPRFYFHIISRRAQTDDLGIELPDLDAAKAEALKFAGAVLKEDKPCHIWQGQHWEMRVTDSPRLDDGRTLLILHLTGPPVAADP